MTWRAFIAKMVPGSRETVMLGLFALAWRVVEILKPQPGQAPSELFKALAQAVVLTGFLAGVSFYFNASKSGAEKNETISKLAGKADGEGK
jgi:MFS-type transporter involved in bile tolerance (Atg22 family)